MGGRYGGRRKCCGEKRKPMWMRAGKPIRCWRRCTRVVRRALLYQPLPWVSHNRFGREFLTYIKGRLSSLPFFRLDDHELRNRAHRNKLWCLCFVERDLQHTVFHRRSTVVGFHCDRQIDVAENLIESALAVERLLAFFLLVLIDFAGDEQPVWLNADLQVLLPEAGYFCCYEQLLLRLGDLHWNRELWLGNIRGFER